MNRIPIFDSLTHPALDGNWLHPQYIGKNTIGQLVKEMKENNIPWAFAVGMERAGGYNIEDYIKFIRKAQKEHGINLFPIAYFSFKNISTYAEIKKMLEKIKNKGYTGVKIHPRLSEISIEDIRLKYVIQLANEMELVVMLCTFFYDRFMYSSGNNIYNLQKLVYEVSDSKIILLHSGAIRVLETVEMFRDFQNVLLDLSFTMCRYMGSSIDLDIKFLFQRFDQRICIGSDSPECSLKQLRERFEYFAKGIQDDKLVNIAYRNIMNFTNLECKI